MDPDTVSVVVELSSAYSAKAVRRAVHANGWRALSPTEARSLASKPFLWWADFARIPWDDVLDGRLAASAHYLKTGLVRKADCVHRMRKHKTSGCVPTTLLAELEDEDDVDEMCADWARVAATTPVTAGESATLWVLKPSQANRAEGIAVLREGDDAALRHGLSAFPSHKSWLLQRYVVPLLLPPDSQPVGVLSDASAGEATTGEASSGDATAGEATAGEATAGEATAGEATASEAMAVAFDSACPDSRPPPKGDPCDKATDVPPGAPAGRSGHKCHLRVHVLVVGALSVWVHDAPLVLLASEPWSEPPASVVGEHADGRMAHLSNHCVQMEGRQYDERSHTRTLYEAFEPELAQSLMDQARAIAMSALGPFARGTASFFALPHCFELFGVDLAVDCYGRAWLLEVNSGPDLALHGERLVRRTSLPATSRARQRPFCTPALSLPLLWRAHPRATLSHPLIPLF